MESRESKYVMAIIKIPVEVFSNGNTVTYDDKIEMDFQEIDKLPENTQPSSINILDKFFSKGIPLSIPNEPIIHEDDIENEPIIYKDHIENEPIIHKDDIENEQNIDKDDDNQLSIAIQEIFKNQLFVKKEEIKKRNRKMNTTFKNKKSKNQRISQKAYSSINSNNDLDVDLVQQPMDPELQYADDQ
jgi:hypothetical protein